MINRFNATVASRTVSELSPLDFEVVDFSDAQEAWHSTLPPVAASTPPSGRSFALESGKPRATPVHERLNPDLHVLPDTLLWAARLPESVRPISLLASFPRVANKIAVSWAMRHSCLPVLEDLLIDRRGGRRGFPADVARELTRLRDYRVLQD